MRALIIYLFRPTTWFRYMVFPQRTLIPSFRLSAFQSSFQDKLRPEHVRLLILPSAAWCRPHFLNFFGQVRTENQKKSPQENR